MSIAAVDAHCANGFAEMVVGIIAAQKAMFDQASHFLAMWTGGNFQPGQQIVTFLLGGTDPATHDWNLPTHRRLLTGAIAIARASA